MLKLSLRFVGSTLLVTGLVFLVGCASKPLFGPVTNVPADRAVVYFYGLPDSAPLPCRIDYNGKRLTKIKGGEYFAHMPRAGTNAYAVLTDMRPGLVGFMLDKPEADVTRIRMQPGKVYYVKTLGAGTLLRVDDATGSAEIQQCRLADKDDADPAEVPPPPNNKRL